jgi:hypothetical protein
MSATMRVALLGLLMMALAGCGGDNLEFCDGCGTPTVTVTPTSTAPTPTATGLTPTPSPTPT